MSKESKPRDRWRQVFASATDRTGHCHGCGYYLAVHNAHRVDCVAPQAVADRQRTRQGHCAGCGQMVDLERLTWTGTRWQCANHATEQRPA